MRLPSAPLYFADEPVFRKLRERNAHALTIGLAGGLETNAMYRVREL